MEKAIIRPLKKYMSGTLSSRGGQDRVSSVCFEKPLENRWDVSWALIRCFGKIGAWRNLGGRWGETKNKHTGETKLVLAALRQQSDGSKIGGGCGLVKKYVSFHWWDTSRFRNE